MTTLEYILDGLEAELVLERELGVRSFEIDPSLLNIGAAKPVATPTVAVETRQEIKAEPRPSTQAKVGSCDVAFIHDRPLSAKGVEMMAKIIAALKLTTERAPIIVAPPLPKAKVVVVLGALALKRYFPELKGAPGQWLKTAEGVDLLVTYSPEYILRFDTVTPAVDKIKKSMWLSLKAVQQRLS